MLRPAPTAPPLGPPLTRLEIIHVNATSMPPHGGPLGGSHSRPRRAARYQDEEGTAQRAHSMEMMVVTDKRMTDYHGNDIINYVLTLMSIVSTNLLIPLPSLPPLSGDSRGVATHIRMCVSRHFVIS